MSNCDRGCSCFYRNYGQLRENTADITAIVAVAFAFAFQRPPKTKFYGPSYGRGPM